MQRCRLVPSSTIVCCMILATAEQLIRIACGAGVACCAIVCLSLQGGSGAPALCKALRPTTHRLSAADARLLEESLRFGVGRLFDDDAKLHDAADAHKPSDSAAPAAPKPVTEDDKAAATAGEDAANAGMNLDADPAAAAAATKAVVAAEADGAEGAEQAPAAADAPNGQGDVGMNDGDKQDGGGEGKAEDAEETEGGDDQEGENVAILRFFVRTIS